VRSYIHVHTDELRLAHEQAIRRSDYAETLFKQRQKLTMGVARTASDRVAGSAAWLNLSPAGRVPCDYPVLQFYLRSQGRE
jgi:hypothetical protein